MGEWSRLVAEYGYLLLFVWVLAEQLGLPLPSAPLLLSAGALAGSGRFSFALATSVAVLGALTGDLVWYRLGRRHGTKVLGRLCRISLSPDSCVRRTENFLARHGLRSLLVAKFIPGINTAAAPLAGSSRVAWWRFLVFDTLGAALWAGTFVALGLVFRRQLEAVATLAAHASLVAVLLLVGGCVIAYVVNKYRDRRRMLDGLRMARITPEELKQKLDAGDKVAILDLRHPLDFLPEPYTIPGAIRLPTEELARRQNEIPRDRDVVLYCTCPNEASSARTAQRLRHYGITRVRPLAGGFHAWREREFPLESEFGPVLEPKRARADFWRAPRKQTS